MCAGAASNGCPRPFAGLNLSIGDTHVVSLDVEVLEVRNIAPRSGWQQAVGQALLASSSHGRPAISTKELPVPVVQVSCSSMTHEVRGPWAAQSLLYTGPTKLVPTWLLDKTLNARAGHVLAPFGLAESVVVTVVCGR